MKLKSRFWADLTWCDFAQLPNAGFIDSVVAVLPLGAVEQHGPHLPLSVDQTLVDGIVQASLPHIAQELPVLFLPTQAIGKSNEHERFPGTLSFSTQTVLNAWMDIGECVARTGIRKLLLFNSHGGHVSVMDLVARDLRAKHDLLVFHSSWFNFPLPAELDGSISTAEGRFGIHAGEVETSMMLALRADTVNMEKAQNFRSTSQDRAVAYAVIGDGRSAKWGWQMQDYNRWGAAGNALAADSAKGHALIANAGRCLAGMLTEISRLPIDTLVATPLDVS